MPGMCGVVGGFETGVLLECGAGFLGRLDGRKVAEREQIDGNVSEKLSNLAKFSAVGRGDEQRGADPGGVWPLTRA